MSLGVPGGRATPPLGGQEGGGKESPLPHPLVGFSLTFIFFFKLNQISELASSLAAVPCCLSASFPSARAAAADAVSL